MSGLTATAKSNVGNADFHFDSETHSYRLKERRLPSVTQVLRALLGEVWQASEWHLQRGRAVHACCALVAGGREFTHDERISGQIAACRKFLANYQPEILEVEQSHYSRLYQYAGTPDLVCRIQGKRSVVDYKASLTASVELQLAGYAELVDCRYGLGVELHEDGSYKSTELMDLKQARREFLTLRSAYGILDRFNRLPKEREQT